MQVPVSSLSYNDKFVYYDSIRRKVIGYAGSLNRWPIDLLIEWDEVRLKLCPNAPQAYVEMEVTNGKGKVN